MSDTDKSESEKLTAEKAEKDKMREAEKTQAKQDAKMKADQRQMELKVKRLIMPLGVRLSNLIAGFVFVGLGAFVVLSPDLAIKTAIQIFAIILILSGFIKIINAFYDKKIGGTKRIIRFLFALFILLTGIGVILAQNLGENYGEDLLILVVAIGLVLQGLQRFFLSLSHKLLPAWIRALMFIVGLFSVVVAIIVFFSLVPSENDLVTLMAYAFFFTGWSRMAFGLVGIRADAPEKKSK